MEIYPPPKKIKSYFFFFKHNKYLNNNIRKVSLAYNSLKKCNAAQIEKYSHTFISPPGVLFPTSLEMHCKIADMRWIMQTRIIFHIQKKL